MTPTLLIVVGALSLLAVVGVAGWLFDRHRGRGHSPYWPSEAAQRRAAARLRYHRDVGDSSNGAGW